MASVTNPFEPISILRSLPFTRVPSAIRPYVVLSIHTNAVRFWYHALISFHVLFDVAFRKKGKVWSEGGKHRGLQISGIALGRCLWLSVTMHRLHFTKLCLTSAKGRNAGAHEGKNRCVRATCLVLSKAPAPNHQTVSRHNFVRIFE